jgi:hypothetical protein
MINKRDPKYKELIKFSNPEIVQEKAKFIYGEDVFLTISPLKNKKYRIYDYLNDKYVDFGQMGFESYDKHQDEERRNRYLKRAMNIKGQWFENPFSPNWASINLLW